MGGISLKAMTALSNLEKLEKDNHLRMQEKCLYRFEIFQSETREFTPFQRGFAGLYWPWQRFHFDDVKDETRISHFR